MEKLPENHGIFPTVQKEEETRKGDQSWACKYSSPKDQRKQVLGDKLDPSYARPSSGVL